MKRSRLVLSSFFFGTGNPDVAEISTVAKQMATDALCLGPHLAAPAPDLLRRHLTERHLRVEVAENVWISRSGPERHLQGEALSSADEADRSDAVQLTIESARHLARVGGEVLVVRLGRVSVPDGEHRSETLRAAYFAGKPPDELAAERSALGTAVEKATVQTLDRVCRALYSVLQETEGVRLGIVTGEPFIGIPTLSMLECILDDLHHPRLGYWHDPVVAREHELFGLGPEGAWLGAHASRLVGAFLHDAQGPAKGLPPGAGEVDWGALRESLPREASRVVRVDGRGGLAALQMAFTRLRDLGFDEGG
ncbi:MAG: hypothetical protein AB1486_11825 [Planctomycetota bacterium]